MTAGLTQCKIRVIALHPKEETTVKLCMAAVHGTVLEIIQLREETIWHPGGTRGLVLCKQKIRRKPNTAANRPQMLGKVGYK